MVYCVQVLVNYCDGGSFSGNNDTVTWTEWNGTTVPVYYRGFSNLQAVVDDLASAHGLQAASDLILSGDSAGGLATLWHADYFAARLPSTRVVAAPDSGYFFADPAVRWGVVTRTPCRHSRQARLCSSQVGRKRSCGLPRQ